MTKQKNFRVIRTDGSTTDYTTLEEVRAEVALKVKAAAAARSMTVSEYLRELLKNRAEFEDLAKRLQREGHSYEEIAEKLAIDVQDVLAMLGGANQRP